MKDKMDKENYLILQQCVRWKWELSYRVIKYYHPKYGLNTFISQFQTHLGVFILRDWYKSADRLTVQLWK